MRTRGLLAAILWLAGCQVSLISDYDPTTDKGVSDLQRGIERHLGLLETLAAEPPGLETLLEACKPEKFDDTYRQLQADLRTLIVRNEAREKNQRTVEQLRDLQKSLETLQQQQRERYEPTDPDRAVVKPGDHCLSRGQVDVNRRALEQHLRAILKLELAKRDFRKEE